MMVVTAGDDRLGTSAQGVLETGAVTFRAMVETSVRQALRFGYVPCVYDLGGLGFGEPFDADHANFVQDGYYRQVSPTYRSKALHKPEIVHRCLARFGEPTLYLDGDAILWRPVDEVEGDYDIAVTMRRRSEFRKRFYRRNRDIMGILNAGVIFFNPTAATRRFIPRWRELTERLGSDQAALNHLVGGIEMPPAGSTLRRDGLWVKYLPSDVYNFYHFESDAPTERTKILHFKGGTRHHYSHYF